MNNFKTNIAQQRTEYKINTLSGRNLDKDPIAQFEAWLDEAYKADIREPNAMTLSTSTFRGKVSSRMVLMKEFSEDGFSFFTNYQSKKGTQILKNPQGSLLFWWSELERQVSIEGKIVKVSEEESDEYFATRPSGSKIGAWASPQSKEIPSRRYLISLKSDFKEEFARQKIKRPENWGGYRLIPDAIEFWQGRANRLHDRIAYKMTEDGWQAKRLAP